MDHYDAVIVGSGAGGGTLAYALANAGKQVALIERGDYVPREPQNWDAAEVFGNSRYISRDTWLDGRGRAFQPQEHYNVGGKTKFYGAALFRLRWADFRGWPLDYADMMPWYDAAEQLYQVRGNYGEDATERPSHSYPHPAVRHAPRIQQLSDALMSAGYHPFHAPVGVLDSRGCILCNTCDGFACQVGAKADAEVIAVRPALRTGNVTLMTNARVTGVRMKGRTATHVYGTQDGKYGFAISGDVIVLSAGAVNSAAILLRSGLGGEQAGRNYMCHVSQAVMVITREPNPTEFQKTLAVNDFYDRYGSIQMLGKSCAEAIAGESRLASLLPRWSLEKMAGHALDFWLMSEDSPDPGNRVTVDAGGRIQLSVRQQDGGASRELYREFRTMLHKAGVRGAFLRKRMPLAAVAHQAGTARMGTDPATSVVDVNCQVHGTDNLHVVDASFMPTVGAMNPALTIMANALRVGHHLAGRLS